MAESGTDQLKHLTQLANQFAMRALCLAVTLLGFSLIAAFAAERALLPGVDDISKSERQLVSGIELAQGLPFERNKIEPIDPKTAFGEGYQAYEHRDLIATIGRM